MFSTLPAMPLSGLILVTGPARSGKSEWAESLVMSTEKPVTYVATAALHSTDLEWQARIEQHRCRRPTHWQTLEVPVDLTQCLHRCQPQQCYLVDSLGTWLANLLEQEENTWQQTQTQLIACLQLQQASSMIVLVAEETGWGVVPAYPLGRSFRDRLGRLTQQVGAIADAVYLVTGGYALPLHQLGIPLRQKTTE